VRPLTLLLLFVSAAHAGAPVSGLPGDPRLAGEQKALQAILDGAQGSALPVELLIAKVREGLAKNIPPPRITAALTALALGLKDAQAEAKPFLSKPPPGLLKAIVDAHALGVTSADLRVVLATSRTPGAAQHAVEVLGDLVQRGFRPASAAALLGAKHGLTFDQATQLLRNQDATSDEGRGPPRESSGPHSPHENEGHPKEHL
jgi:hypothetical protein